jgi:hypothetical protein
VRSYIVDLKPDLLIIGGISGTKPDDNEECIRQMREAGCNPEIMLMTGPITPRFERDGQPWPTAIDLDGGRSGRSALLQEAIERNYAFFDIQSPFSQYEFSAGKTPEFYRRDSIHANDRARTILAKIVECWFSPDSAARAE